MIAKTILSAMALLVACSLTDLHASERTIRNIMLPDELPSNTVYRMFQDSDGFMWLGTPDGFCRYDGYETISFRSAAGGTTFPSNNITGGFAEDTATGKIWIGTRMGVLTLDKQTHRIDILDSVLLGRSTIRQIMYDGNAMWVCSDSGLYLYGGDGTLKQKYLDGANGVHIDREGTVRVMNWSGGMYRLDRATDTFVPYPPIGQNNNPHSIFQDNSGNFWICTWGDGLYRFYPDRHGPGMYERVEMAGVKEFDTDTFFRITQDTAAGCYWTVSYNGLVVFGLDGDRTVPLSEVMSPVNDVTNIFSDIIKDRDGNIWLGTYELGAMVTSPDSSPVTNFALQSIKAETGFLPNVTTAICEDGDGEIWFKQSRLGVCLLNPVTGRIRWPDVPGVSDINAICRYSQEDEIWVAMDYVPNIHRFRKSGDRITMTGTMDMGGIVDGDAPTVEFLHEDARGVMWAATEDDLLFYRRGEWHVARENIGNITGITEDSYGAIWLGTAGNGLLRVVADGDRVDIRVFDTGNSSMPGNDVSCLSATDDGRLWFCVNEKMLFNYDIEEDLFSDCTDIANMDGVPVLNIVAGEEGRVWLSTSKHVMEFNSLTDALIRYVAQEDLIVSSINRNAVAQRRDGSVVFGGNRGLFIINPSPQPELYGEGSRARRTMVTDVKIDGVSVYGMDAGRHYPDGQQKLVLSHSERNVEINFSAFDYLNPGKLRYAYKLEGVDEQWIYPESGRTFAIYNQLRRGEYSFLVRSTGHDRLWSEQITRMTVVKKPAFYETDLAYVLYGVLVLLILLAGSKFYANRVELRNELHLARLEKESSEELIQTKLRFFTNIGHEFRTPLTLIMTPLSAMINESKDDGLRQKLSSVHRNAGEMLGLINQLLDFRKLEMGGEKLKLSCDDIVAFIRYIHSAFRDVAAGKSIEFTFESDIDRLFVCFDSNKVRKIINNIYSNALKFTPEHGYIATTVRLEYESGREFVRIEVADSGCGISENERQMIFERFYQSEHNDPDETGTGIGLHLVKEYVELHGGHIEVDSSVGNGSLFAISLPTDMRADEDASGPKEEPRNETPTAVEPERKSITVLIAEDNTELRRFLASQLGGKFTVLEAADGEKGLSMAREKLPDIVVSDLMMPGLNGLDMCGQLKGDIRTSHIPFIMLTAKLSDETKMECYRVGADSFIAKPFNFEVLLARIEALIEQQEKRRKLLRKTIEITPSSIAVSSLDEKLIAKALAAVEKEIDNPDFSVDELASTLALSRRHMSRKFHSVIGMSPGEFIRSVRLKRAAQLLEDSQYTISEISDMVSFGSIKYFNIYFKEKFGMTPSQYRSEKKIAADEA